MNKEELFRRQVRMSQIKLNLPMIPYSQNSAKRTQLLRDRILTRSSTWLLFSYKLEKSIRNTVGLIKQKIKQIEENIKLIDRGEEVEPLHNEHIELMLARQYEQEIDNLKEIVNDEKGGHDELQFKNGVLVVLMDRLKQLLYLIGVHK